MGGLSHAPPHYGAATSNRQGTHCGGTPPALRLPGRGVLPGGGHDAARAMGRGGHADGRGHACEEGQGGPCRTGGRGRRTDGRPEAHGRMAQARAAVLRSRPHRQRRVRQLQGSERPDPLRRAVQLRTLELRSRPHLPGRGPSRARIGPIERAGVAPTLQQVERQALRDGCARQPLAGVVSRRSEAASASAEGGGGGGAPGGGQKSWRVEFREGGPRAVNPSLEPEGGAGWHEAS